MRFAFVFSGLVLIAPCVQAASGVLSDPLRASTVLNDQTPSNRVIVDDTSCPTPESPLTLEDAVVTALCRNPSTGRTWASVQASVAGLGSARSAYLPTLSGSVGLSHNYASTNGLTAEGSPSNGLTPGITLSMLLLDFGGRSATVEGTTQALLAADYTHNAMLQTVVNNAIAAYYNMASAEAGVLAARSSEESAKTAWLAAKTRVDVGVATPVDELQARSTYAQAQLTRREAEHTRDTAQGTLANTMGLEPNLAFTLAQPGGPSQLNDADAELEKNIEPLLAMARKRPDVAAAFASYKQAEASVQSAKSAGLPSLNATASYNGSRALSGGNRGTNAAAGLTLSVPLFTGFNRHYEIQAAQRNADAAKASADAALNNALLDVWTAHATFKSALDTRTMTKTLLESATEAEKLALGRYKTGVGTITELLSAESQLSSARQQAVKADSGVSIARADLLRAIGTLSPDNLAFVEK